jgi:glucose-6-phosphate dehydrogenase assembly protein OpcA
MSEVTCAAVEGALAEQRRALQPADAEHPPVRTSTLTLVVLASSAASATVARETLARLRVDHPSRTICLVVAGQAPGAGDSQPTLVEATVNVSVEGDRAGPDGYLLAEEVTLAAAGEGVRRLSGMVAPLLLPDLPAYLWLADWPAAEALLAGQYDWLLDDVDLAIFDTAAGAEADGVGAEGIAAGGLDGETTDPAGCLRALCLLDEATGRDLAVADLAWVRIEPWRELVAQCFDPVAARPVASWITSAEVTYEESPARQGDVPSTDALLLGGWLRSRLPSLVSVTFRAVPERAGTPGWIGGVSLADSMVDGRPVLVRIDWADDRAQVSADIPGSAFADRLVRFPVMGRADLLGRLLHAPADDALFAAALAAAVRLA